MGFDEENVSGATGCVAMAFDLFEQLSRKAPKNFQEELTALVQRVVVAHPEMSALRAIAHAVKQCASAAAVTETVAMLRVELADAIGMVADEAAALVRPCMRIATISASGTVKQALLKAGQEHAIEVVVTEGRPMCEGVKLAKELAKVSIAVELGVDGAMLELLKMCDMVWVGADTIGDDYFVNKIGTLALLLGAKHLKIPCYVLADRFKRLPLGVPYRTAGDRSACEVLENGGKIKVRNPYFEVIPLEGVIPIIK